MQSTIRYSVIVLMACVVSFHFAAFNVCNAADKDIDICTQVSAKQLEQLYKKQLYPTKNNSGCYWSLEPGGMAYFDIGIHERYKDLREYWNKELSSMITLEKITDLGDEGLMNVSEGDLGVIVIRKDKWILRSAVTFLDIEPGSRQHKALWDIYRSILENL